MLRIETTLTYSDLPQGFQSSALARPRSNLPPGLDLRPSYHRSLFPFSKLAQQADAQTQNHQTQGTNPVNHQSHGLANAQPMTPHQAQAPHSPHQSLAYSSAPLLPPQDFHIPNSQEVYGGVQYSHSDNDMHGYAVGVNSAPNTAHLAEQSLEPESYYKSEPDTRRMTLAQNSTHHAQQPPPPPPHYHQSVHNSTNQLLQPPQTQHYHPLTPAPQVAGIKRSRDEDGEEYVERGPPGSEIGGGSRRRSFTLPTGYGSGQSG